MDEYKDNGIGKLRQTIRKKEQRKKKGGLNPSDIPTKPEKIKVKKIEPDFTIKNTGSTEGMKDAAKIEGKPHSSPEGRFMSELRSRPLKVVTFKNGGSVRLARKGGEKAYGKNS